MYLITVLKNSSSGWIGREAQYPILEPRAKLHYGSTPDPNIHPDQAQYLGPELRHCSSNTNYRCSGAAVTRTIGAQVLQ